MDAIQDLRRTCNEMIRKINHGKGVNTAGFRDINALLKKCDAVFAQEDEKRHRR